MYNDQNVFAKIVRGEIPSKKVYETPHSLSFFDINPTAKTHILVIPKGGYTNIMEFIELASDIEKADFWNHVSFVALKSGVQGNFRIQANTGEKAGQTVPHFHIHIMSNE